MSFLSRIFKSAKHVTNIAKRGNITKTSLLSSKTPSLEIIKEVDPNTGEVKKKKVNTIPKITLLSGNTMSVTTLPEAEKLSKRRDLKLVKVIDFDVKTQRPVYKLMTGTEYYEEDLKQREQRKLQRANRNIKGEKILLLNSKVARHDLDIQLRKVDQWLKKMYEVRGIISGATGNITNSEKVYTFIEEHFRNQCEGKIVQKRQTGADIKFQIVPIRMRDNNSDNL